MTNVISILSTVRAIRERSRSSLDDETEKREFWLRGWAQGTDDKCGRATTVRLLERALERLRKRSLSGE